MSFVMVGDQLMKGKGNYMVQSKYQPFWETHKNTITQALLNVVESGNEEIIHLPGIQEFGDRQNWWGTIVIREGNIISGGDMAHIRALGNLIIPDITNLHGITFRLSMNNQFELKVKLDGITKKLVQQCGHLQSYEEIVELLTNPTKLWSRSEVLSKPCPVPQEPGIYAWYFKEIPPKAPVEKCKVVQGLTLLYVGISPRNEDSGENLKKRIRTHYKDDAEFSTLRRSLGCLLREQLDIRLQSIGISGQIIHFADGEETLSEWMQKNAFVTWVMQEEPWTFEKQIIKQLNLPLNLKRNEDHPFHPILSSIRKKCVQGVMG